jgi:hypothetical protein
LPAIVIPDSELPDPGITEPDIRGSGFGPFRYNSAEIGENTADYPRYLFDPFLTFS